MTRHNVSTAQTIYGITVGMHKHTNDSKENKHGVTCVTTMPNQGEIQYPTKKGILIRPIWPALYQCELILSQLNADPRICVAALVFRWNLTYYDLRLPNMLTASNKIGASVKHLIKEVVAGDEVYKTFHGNFY